MAHILDDHLAESKTESNLLKIIQYWESRRKSFNIAVGLAGLLPMIFLGSQEFLTNPFIILFFIMIYGFFANACYCLGWGIDVIRWYYLNDNNFGKYKEILWLCGLIFSIFITLFLSTGTWLAIAFNGFPD